MLSFRRRRRANRGVSSIQHCPNVVVFSDHPPQRFVVVVVVVVELEKGSTTMVSLGGWIVVVVRWASNVSTEVLEIE